jgi:L-fuculose-phosphate aldolase
MNEPIPTTIEEQIAYLGRLMFERRLTDLSGGNISVRSGERVYITPRYSGSQQHWNVRPETILSGSFRSNELLDHPDLSREGKAHIEVYRHFPGARAIVHAHPFYVLPFCAAQRAIVPVLESTEKFGVIEPLPYAPTHTQELADIIVAGLKAKEALIARHSAVLLLARHGLFTVSTDLFMCLDATERINWNAWCILAQAMMPAGVLPA